MSFLTLQADRQKEATKKREEEEKLEQERLEAAIRHSEEIERERIEKEKARIRSKIMSKLPLEPKEEKDEGQPVSKLRFRVPVRVHDDLEMECEGSKKKIVSQANGIVKGGTGNQQLERRFLASNTLQTVLDYLTTEGYPSSDFKVLSSWPRRDVSSKKASLVYFDGKTR